MKKIITIVVSGVLLAVSIISNFGNLASVYAAPAGISAFKARPPIHILRSEENSPHGLAPGQVKAFYHLPATGGKGTIAIITAHDDPTIEDDLAVFSTQFGLPLCTVKNGCLEKHILQAKTTSSSDWSLETSLDVEWAHAIAPSAKILLVEAYTTSGTDLLKAVDYARTRSDVVAVSMSWGGPEFSTESLLDSYFTSSHGATFFASSGDNGSGVSWPAVSPNVVAVGGTGIVVTQTGAFQKEYAWSGSGGGISIYEPEPDFQRAYSIPKAGGKRAVPDVAYNADPNSGFSVYKSPTTAAARRAHKGWYVVGGTSAGAPQWAAIRALGGSASNIRFYQDKASTALNHYFRDIVSGSNGSCDYYCDARRRYDYVTGLGTPLTAVF